MNQKLIDKNEKSQQLISEGEDEQQQSRKTVINDQQEESPSEDEQQDKQKDNQIKQLQNKVKNRTDNNKMVVGTGFSFDITEFFKFERKKKQEGKQETLFDQISGGHLAWFILLYSVCNAALIPPWIMNIKANKLIRICWRFLLQSVMAVPFVLYQRRTATPQILQKYSFSYIFAKQNFIKIYISSFATTFWFTIVLTTFEWTSISHAMVLSALSNFFLSIFRTINKKNHDLQPGGQVLVILGILLILEDTIMLNPDLLPARYFQVINPFYLGRNTVQRVLGDLMAFFVSFCMAKFSQFTSDLRSYYPPYLSMMLVNILICINMLFSSFFFNGTTFDFDPGYGIFSIFSQMHFAGFLYMSIILCLGLLMSFMMIAKLFPEPIIPALAMVIQPVISTMILQLSGVQDMPGPFAFVGYVLIVPGVFLILVGQCLYQRSQQKQEQDEKKRLEQLKEMREMKHLQTIEDEKARKSKSVPLMKLKKSNTINPTVDHTLSPIKEEKKE